VMSVPPNEETTSLARCEECERPFVAAATSMRGLCAECAHLLYGTPACTHTWVDGRCSTCGWNGVRSAYTTTLVTSRGEGEV
jgi:predicted RNA-binding Zn-ribbon protein involved in translation (DUF1610 family)